MSFIATKVLYKQNRLICLSDKGDVYLKGIDFELTEINSMTPFIQNYNITQIELSSNYILFLTNENILYTIGYESYDSYFELNNPKKLNFDPKNDKVIKITCGDRHSLILMSNYKVYSFGDNSFSQCSGKEESILYPKEIILSDKRTKILNIFTGSNFNYLFTSTGDLLSFGDNLYGKLGYYNSSNQEHIPQILPYFKGYLIGDVFLSENQSIVITTNHKKSLDKK